jgi:hypothetical protein
MNSPCVRNYRLRSGVLNIAAVLCLLVSAVYPARSQSDKQCGAGWCNLEVAPVQKLTTISGALIDDINAQYPAYTGNVSAEILIVAGKPLSLSASGYQGFFSPDGDVGANITVTASAKPNFFPAWVQIINTNYNNVGYTDVPVFQTTATGPGIEQKNVDSTGPNPNYDNGKSTPPHFEDGPHRADPTPAHPLVTWSAELYLTSDNPDKHTLDVYGGILWGWQSFYTPEQVVKTVSNTLTDAVMGGSGLDGATASGVYGVATLSNGQTYLFGDLTVNEDQQGQMYQYNFDYACNSLAPQCGVESDPSQINPNFNVSLDIDSFALVGSSSVVPVSFDDFIFTNAGSGTLTQAIDFQPNPPISNTPLPSTWALMLAGLGIVGFVGHRKRKATSVTFSTA